MVRRWTYDPQEPGEEQLLLPGFGLRWFPKGKKKPHWSELLVEIEVSGLSKKITRFEALHGAADVVAIDLRQFTTNRTEKPHGSK